MKKVLVMAENYAPASYVSAVRLTKIVKHLKKMTDYEVTVLTRGNLLKTFFHTVPKDSILESEIEYADHLIKTDNRKILDFLWRFSRDFYKYKINKWLKTNANITPKAYYDMESTDGKRFKPTSLLKGIFIFIYEILMVIFLKDFINQSLNKIKDKKYDVILSTYGPPAFCFVAGKYKEQNPNTLWIADFRDPLFGPFAEIGTYPSRYIRAFLKTVSKHADYLTGVTKSCLSNILKKNKSPGTIGHGKKRVISNGFDRDDLEFVKSHTDYPLTPSDEKFTISYLGSLYPDRQIVVVVVVVNELIAEGKIDRNKLQYIYAGSSEHEFKRQIAPYNVDDVLICKGWLDRLDSIRIQLQSHILLHATWNKPGETDVLTGKLLEYMMMERPIVSCIMGEVSDSRVKKEIERANIGFAWEEATDDVDRSKLKEYILMQYHRFEQGVLPLLEPDREYIDRYDYKNLTKQFIELIEV